MLSHHFFEEVYRLLTLKFEGKLDSSPFLESSNEIDLPPLTRDIYFLAQNLDPTMVCLIGLPYDAAEKLFGESDHITIIGIGTVQFA